MAAHLSPVDRDLLHQVRERAGDALAEAVRDVMQARDDALDAAALADAAVR